jgi:hypothetical protein
MLRYGKHFERQKKKFKGEKSTALPRKKIERESPPP